MSSSGFVWTGQSGCLLPLLIILNLFFGRLFFPSTAIWLGVEGLLLLLFILKMRLFARKISSQFKRGGRIVDVEGEVLEDKEQKK